MSLNTCHFLSTKDKERLNNQYTLTDDTAQSRFEMKEMRKVYGKFLFYIISSLVRLQIFEIAREMIAIIFQFKGW